MIHEYLKNSQGIFVLKSDPGPQESQASGCFYDVGTSTYVDTDKCNACHQSLRPPVKIPPLSYEIEVEGKDVGDILFGPAASILVSEKFMKGFTEEKLNGIEKFQPAQIVHVKRGEKKFPPTSEYHLISIAKIGRLDVQKSSLEEQPSCDVCLMSTHYKRVRRVILEPSSWDNMDIFTPFGILAIVLTSARFRTFCIEKGISNAVFIPAVEFFEDFFPWEKAQKQDG